MPGLVIPGRPWEIEAGWFETVAKPFIDQAQPDELVASWEQACAADDLLERVGRESVEFRRAIRWAERRIGEVLGDSSTRNRPDAPNLVRSLNPKQKSQFRAMAGVPAIEFVQLLEKAEAHTELTRAQIAKWCKRKTAHTEELDARATSFDATVADAEGDRWKMLHGDFRSRLSELEPGSVDIIITDPPYPAEFLPLWADLSAMAGRLLKPQGVLLAMSGKIHLPEVMAALSTHLQYGWIYAMPLKAGTRIMGRKVMQSWKPWLAYSNGPWPSGTLDAHRDLLDNSNKEKSRYRWEQDPDDAGRLLDIFDAHQTAVIVDPFVGTGSFGYAAVQRGNQFIGVELDKQRFLEAADRIGAAA